MQRHRGREGLASMMWIPITLAVVFGLIAVKVSGRSVNDAHAQEQAQEESHD